MLKNIYQYDFRMLRILKFICSATESHEYYTYEYSQRHSPTPQPPPHPPQKRAYFFYLIELIHNFTVYSQAFGQIDCQLWRKINYFSVS